MKIEQRTAGSFRVRKTYKGKTYTLKFDHKPTAKEVAIKLGEIMESSDIQTGSKRTFNNCAQEFLRNRGNVLSKSTLRSYKSVSRAISDDFGNMNIFDIDQTDIQKEINRYSVKHAPKTVRNFHGFISAVFGEYRPKMALNTSLPAKVKVKIYRPIEDDIKTLLEGSKNNPMWHICFQLGVLGLRRSEVCGLTINDLNGTELNIHCAMIDSGEKGNRWIIQEKNKNDTSSRTIQIGQPLADEIRELGFICDQVPSQLLKHLHQYQDKLGIPRFRFHDLRHYFASYAHTKGIPDVYIMHTGGWKSPYVMNQIYKEALENEVKPMQEKMAKMLLS